MHFRFLFLFIALISSILSSAQEKVDDPNDTRRTEADIAIEDKFVSAKYFALIGKNDKAIKILDSIRRLTPENGVIYYELAKIYNTLKDYNLAEGNLQSAVKALPNNRMVRDFEVSYYTQIGRSQSAIKALNELITLYPNEDMYYDKLIAAYSKQNDLATALKVATTWEMQKGQQENTLRTKAMIYEKQGKVDEAASELNKLANKYPTSVKYLRDIVVMLESNGQKQKAIPYLERIQKLQPDNEDVKLALMVYGDQTVKSDNDFVTMLHPMVDNPNIAIDTKVKELLPIVTKHASTGDTVLGKSLINICNKLILAHPNEAKAHAMFGDVLMNDGKTDAAIIQYEKTLTLNKRNFMVWEQLMNGLDLAGNTTQLDKVASEAIDFFPNNAISYYYVAKVAAMAKNTNRAQEYINEASLISAKNSWLNSKISGLKGYISLSTNKVDEAITFLKAAVDISEQKNGEAYEWLGDAYKLKGMTKESKEAYAKALALGYKSKTLVGKI